jgi:hypothetical protein
MFTVVRRRPRLTTYIAKLILASASHMITALVLFNYKATFFALSIVKILLEKKYLLFVTLSLMIC